MEGVRRILDRVCRILELLCRILDRVCRIFDRMCRILNRMCSILDGVALRLAPHTFSLCRRTRTALVSRNVRDSVVPEEDR